MENLKTFDPIIYPYKIYFCITDDLNFINEKFIDSETGKDFVWEEDARYAAYSLPIETKDDNFYGTLILFKEEKYLTPKTIAHEASHAAKQLFEHIGADMKAHEPFEYLLGWIVESIHNTINK